MKSEGRVREVSMGREGRVRDKCAEMEEKKKKHKDEKRNGKREDGHVRRTGRGEGRWSDERMEKTSRDENLEQRGQNQGVRQVKEKTDNRTGAIGQKKYDRRVTYSNG